MHQRLGPRGVNSVKVESIICKLFPLMAQTHKICWQNLPSSANVKDLTVTYDHLSSKQKQNKDTLKVSGKRMSSSERELLF